MASKLPVGETVGMALSTLRANRLRSLLTMLGIVIGNASVITLVGVGRGAQNLAEGQLSNLGANVLFVVPGNNDTRRQGIDFPKTLVLEDAEAIAEQVPSVSRVAPQITLSEVLQVGGISTSASVLGVTPEFLPVRQFEMQQGRFFSSSDLGSARSVAVIGPDLAAKMFPGQEALGRNLRVRNQAFEVIGVLAPKGAVFGQNQDENAYIPLSTMVNQLSGRDPTYGISLNFISVEARDADSINAAAFQITNLLRQRHRILREDDFAVRSQKDALTIVSTITGGLTLMLAAIGGVSLLVGGIGIMNIMLVSVSERTAEIGLRKALGARSGDVLLQFLVESLVLASLGGAIGTALGIGTVALVGVVTPLPAAIGTSTVLLTVALPARSGCSSGWCRPVAPPNSIRSWPCAASEALLPQTVHQGGPQTDQQPATGRTWPGKAKKGLSLRPSWRKGRIRHRRPGCSMPK
jgi:ABC-type antimicrobial peptide transport system, permease component